MVKRPLSLIKTSTMLIELLKKKIPHILIVVILAGCSKYEGAFAYKTVELDHYERLAQGMQFEQKQRVDWVFVPDTEVAEQAVGVVVLQKRALWIDIAARTVKVNALNPNIYGSLITDTPGEYQIQLVIDNTLAASVSYEVYPQEESDPFQE